MLTRRSLTQHIALAGAASACAPFALAQASVARLMIGFPPGSTFDAFARRTADKLRGTIAPSVIVENKTGAGGQIAVTTIKDSAADGSNILISPSALFTINPHTYKKLPYKPGDLKPVATCIAVEPAFAVGPAVPESVKTLKDYIKWSKEDPKGAMYAVPSTGSILHMVGAYIALVSNVKWQNVAYRGSGPIIQDLMSGQITSAILPLSEYVPFVKTGKVRVLAVSGKERSKFLPDVPTLRQGGIPMGVREWHGCYLPGGASTQVVSRTAAYLQVVLNDPEMVNWMKSMSLQHYYKGPDETAAALKADLDEWRYLIKAIGFSAES